MKKKVPLSAQMRIPKLKKEILFCEHYIKCRDRTQAAEMAGYSDPRKRSWELSKRFTAYLSHMLELHAKEISREIVYDQQDLLNEMAAIGFSNPLDYIVVKDEQQDDGTCLKKMYQKPLHELTRRQACAINKVRFENGDVSYSIPSPNQKFQYLFSLAKNLGLFSDKLILEHRNRNIKADMDLSQAKPEQLLELEKLLIDMIGPEANKLLGLKTPT